MLVGSGDSPYHRLLACMQRNTQCNSSRADMLGCRGMDAVMLDDCNFHQSVSLDRFETERLLELVPPDGEFCCDELSVHLPLQTALPGTDCC